MKQRMNAVQSFKKSLSVALPLPMLASLVAVAVLTCGAVINATAQNEKETNPSAADTLAEASSTAAQLAATVDSVRGQFQAAQKAGDPIKAVCLDDKLSQLEAASKTAGGRLESLKASVETGDSGMIARDAAMMKALSQSAANLSAGAKQCVGEEKAVLGISSSLNVVVDPNIVQSDVVQAGSLNMAAVATSVQAGSPVAPPDDMMKGPIEVSPAN
jgi:hypothetical protein